MKPVFRPLLLGLSLVGAMLAAPDARAVPVEIEPDFTSEVFTGNDSTKQGAASDALEAFIASIVLSDGSTFDETTLTLISRQKDETAFSDEGTQADGWLQRYDCGGVGSNDPCNEQSSGYWTASGDVQLVIYKAGKQFVALVFEDIIAAETQVLFDLADYPFGASTGGGNGKAPKGLSHLSIWTASIVPPPAPVPLPPSVAFLIGSLGLLGIGRRLRKAA